MSEIIALAVFCLIVIVASLAMVVWTVVSGALLSLDGLLLVFICLMLAAVFGACLLWLAYDAGWLASLKSGGTAPSGKKD